MVMDIPRHSLSIFGTIQSKDWEYLTLLWFDDISSSGLELLERSVTCILTDHCDSEICADRNLDRLRFGQSVSAHTSTPSTGCLPIMAQLWMNLNLV